jgi:hypothetical protein
MSSKGSIGSSSKGWEHFPFVLLWFKKPFLLHAFVPIGAGFQTGVYKIIQSPTEPIIFN